MMGGMIPKHHQDLFATPAFPAQGLSEMLVSPGKGSCHHHRFAHALARWHCKQWVPGRLIGLGVRSFTLNILQENPIFVIDCEKQWVFNHKIPMIYQFQIYTKKKKLRKNSSFNWFTPFHVLIRPDVIWKNLSRPLYHVHFTVIHTTSRHNRVVQPITVTD